MILKISQVIDLLYLTSTAKCVIMGVGNNYTIKRRNAQ